MVIKKYGIIFFLRVKFYSMVIVDHTLTFMRFLTFRAKIADVGPRRNARRRPPSFDPPSILGLGIHGGWCRPRAAPSLSLAIFPPFSSSEHHHDHRSSATTAGIRGIFLPQSFRRHDFSSRPRRTKAFAACPFRTLNIPKDSTYAHARKAFLKIAMKHHPDKAGSDVDEETRDRSREIFVRCRAALESLVECECTGACLPRSEAERPSGTGGGGDGGGGDAMSDEEFDSWFARETGHQNPFQFDLDPATMREVADMHDGMAGSHGLDRDGGMWHLASLISSAVKSGKEGGAESLLRLEAGNPSDAIEAGGKLDRRRKRRTTRR